MSVMQQHTWRQARLSSSALTPSEAERGQSTTEGANRASLGGSGLGGSDLGGRGLGSGALARAVERWRRAALHDHAQTATTSSSPGSATTSTASSAALAVSAVSADELAALTRRLDDSGCSYGRVSAARLDAVTRAYDRLETKMNAVLMAVTGTFLSTLAGLLLYYVRGGGQ